MIYYGFGANSVGSNILLGTRQRSAVLHSSYFVIGHVNVSLKPMSD